MGKDGHDNVIPFRPRRRRRRPGPDAFGDVSIAARDASRPPSEGTWRDKLTCGADGTPKRSFANAVTILRNDPELTGRLRHDTMARADEYNGRLLTPADYSAIRVHIERRYGVGLSDNDIVKAVHLVASWRPYHPVEAYLRSLTWDGEARIDRFLEGVLRVPARDHTDDQLRLRLAIVRKWFLSAVARPLSPGCQVDTVLILQGPQGGHKSSLFRVLGGAWFSDADAALDSKSIYQVMRTAWIWEWSELAAFRKANDLELKGFVTRRSDVFTPPRSRAPVTAQRRGVIVGTTNDEKFLRDPTGDRRYWIIPVTRIDIELARQWRDQLWAEAVRLFDDGNGWNLTGDEEALRESESGRYRERDPWEGEVARWVAARSEPFTMRDVLEQAVSIPRDQQGKAAQNHMAEILKRIGCVRERHPKTSATGARSRRWSR